MEKQCAAQGGGVDRELKAANMPTGTLKRIAGDRSAHGLQKMVEDDRYAADIPTPPFLRAGRAAAGGTLRGPFSTGET